MQSKRARLDRFISVRTGINKKNIRLLLAQGRVTVDGVIARDIDLQVNEFSHVVFDDQVLQQNQPIYMMLNKPVGVVSATVDDKHQTVIDLLQHPQKTELHLVGRLDLNTSGLVLLTNDGRWSTKLMEPEYKVSKYYRVTLAKPLTEDYIEAFAKGFYFDYEGITTQPAVLRILSDYVAEVELTEGRYHQIKRMFGRFQNQVMALHRYQIGGLALDASLAVGQSRLLTEQEKLLLIK
ncbi:pseudouridine synthase [Shewanella marina]|uniref:pseudouridine synthase n=1 Tax=Shewanella marina TaxID=487319 RepID=UPI00046F7748|nr:16S rRNA pseudouridine(516) synthase [Shewanella marina]